MTRPTSNRRDLVAFLRGLGASDDQMAAAEASGRLPSLAVDLSLRSSQVLTPREVADRLGRPVEDVLGLLDVLGLTRRDPDQPSLTEADVTLLALAPEIGLDLLRVAGASLGRLADAGVASYVQIREAELVDTGADALTWAEASAEVGELGQLVGGGLGSLFVHHVQEAIRWQREAQTHVDERELGRMAVGFVDMAGFTPLSGRLPPVELIELITDFEVAAHAAAALHGGRIVKHIGDEIMFVALDPATAVRLTATLFASLPADTFRLCGGISFGDLLVHHGDYYGPIVNLASRLADEAIPGEVLVDERAARDAEALDAGVRFEPAGRRLLRGFDEPVATCSLVLDAP